MAWIALQDVELSDVTHPDAAGSIHAVRAALSAVSARYLDPEAVTVNLQIDDRAAYFRFPHSSEPGVEVCFRQGDGWFHLESPLGDHDGYIEDEDLTSLVVALLRGDFIQTTRFCGPAWVERRMAWRTSEGTLRTLSRDVHWPSTWRLVARATSERFERHSLSLDRVPAVSRI